MTVEPKHSFPRRPLTGTALAVALFAACATAERAPGQSTEAEEAVAEAREELPGVVLTARRIIFGNQAVATLAAPDSTIARTALDDAFAVSDSIGDLLGLHVAGSELNRINQAAGREPVAVSPWTEAVVAIALEWAERSDGAFDPTVGPVADLWGFGTSAAPVPDEDAIREAMRRVGWRKVRHDPEAHTVFLTEEGMVLDLRAIAKGFVLDRMREVMEAAGATSGIVDIEGDVLFFGRGTESSSDLWTISLPNPYEPGRSYARFELPPGAVSTSAAMDRAIEIDGVRYGHLIDPRTGRPVQGLASVSTYAPDAVTSDIAATALYVLGPRDGPSYVEQWPGVEAVFVPEPEPRSHSVVVVTSGLEEYRREIEPPYRPVAPEDR